MRSTMGWSCSINNSGSAWLAPHPMRIPTRKRAVDASNQRRPVHRMEGKLTLRRRLSCICRVGCFSHDRPPGLGLPERETLCADVDQHGVAVADLARQDAPRERVLDLALNGAAQRARAVDGVVAL